MQVLDTFEKNEKLTTRFEAIDGSDVLNKFYLDEKFKTIDAHTSSNKNRLQRIQVTIQQTICRRNFNSKSCEND